MAAGGAVTFIDGPLSRKKKKKNLLEDDEREKWIWAFQVQTLLQATHPTSRYEKSVV